MVVLGNLPLIYKGYYTFQKISLGSNNMNHLDIRSKMVQVVFYASDDHRPFVKSLRLDASSALMPCGTLSSLGFEGSKPENYSSHGFGNSTRLC